MGDAAKRLGVSVHEVWQVPNAFESWRMQRIVSRNAIAFHLARRLKRKKLKEMFEPRVVAFNDLPEGLQTMLVRKWIETRILWQDDVTIFSCWENGDPVSFGSMRGNPLSVVGGDDTSDELCLVFDDGRQFSISNKLHGVGTYFQHHGYQVGRCDCEPLDCGCVRIGRR